MQNQKPFVTFNLFIYEIVKIVYVTKSVKCDLQYFDYFWLRRFL